MRRFTQFAGLDWSGEAVERPKGVALATCAAHDDPPALIRPPSGWSRHAVLDWLIGHAEAGTDMLIGIDFSPSLPFADHGSYFPGWPDSPADSHALWALVETVCAEEAHLSASAFPRHAHTSRHYRQQIARATIVGDAFEPGLGRLRVVERICRTGGHGNAISSLSLVGPAQVGKSSLTGMRLLHCLAGRVPIWPFDPVPEKGPLIVEIYTAIAARAAGLPPGRTKLRDGDALDRALERLASRVHVPLARYDDHSTDAILTAAWLRAVHSDTRLWSPTALTPGLAATEGWTFGVP